MAAVKTNERPGTRAVLSSYHASAYKFREVLDLIRGRDIKTAREILAGLERDVARVIGKLLDSAVANAVNNDRISESDLFVASCYADEGPTMKRFRARARGRAGALRKRTAHVTVIVARMEEDQLKVVRSKRDAEEANRRARRVARTRGSAAAKKAATESKPEPAEVVETGTTVADGELSSEIETPVVEADQVEEPAAVDTGAIEGAHDVIDTAEVADEAGESTESEEEEN